MYKSLDEDGNEIYKLGKLSSTDNLTISLKLLLKSKNNTLTKNISLFEYIPQYKESNQAYNYYEKDHIPVIELNSFSRMSSDDNSIEKFLEDGKMLNGVDKLIIDLRGNPGGSMINIEKWYKGFTGQSLPNDIVEAGLYTDTSIALSENKFKSKKNEPEDIKDICLDKIESYSKKDFYPGWSPIKYEESPSIENDSNIIILVDKNTSSAAEFFVYYLKKMEKVSTVGTITNGCVLTGNCNTAYLPNSNIKINISHKIYMSKDLNNIDGLGLMPDYWVKPRESMKAAINYLQKK